MSKEKFEANPSKNAEKKKIEQFSDFDPEKKPLELTAEYDDRGRVTRVVQIEQMSKETRSGNKGIRELETTTEFTYEDYDDGCVTRTKTYGPSMFEEGYLRYNNEGLLLVKSKTGHLLRLWAGPYGWYDRSSNYTYDNKGRVVEHTESEGYEGSYEQKTYEYDEAGRVIKEHTENSGGATYDFSFEYDAEGNPLRSVQVAYAHDSIGTISPVGSRREAVFNRETQQWDWGDWDYGIEDKNNKE